MNKQHALVIIDRGLGKKERVEMQIVAETTTGLYCIPLVGVSDTFFGPLKSEWFPFDSKNIQTVRL